MLQVSYSAFKSFTYSYGSAGIGASRITGSAWSALPAISSWIGVLIAQNESCWRSSPSRYVFYSTNVMAYLVDPSHQASSKKLLSIVYTYTVHKFEVFVLIV